MCTPKSIATVVVIGVTELHCVFVCTNMHTPTDMHTYACMHEDTPMANETVTVRAAEWQVSQHS
jgi:hypothetical protein